MHAARAACAWAYCAALGVATLILSNPLLLAAIVVALLLAAAGARVGRELAWSLKLAIPLAITIALINALVVRDGLTVIVRLGDLPVFGQTDITLEATAYGGVLALRAFALILCGALYTAAVDPDEVLALFRRVSFHSALTATLATRMIPVLARDSRRLADAQRCRSGPPPSRVALMRAVSSSVFDRALDVASALEVRGYATARHATRRRRPVSRHDLAFGCSAAAVLALAVVIRAANLAWFHAYPALHGAFGIGAAALAAALVVLALAPFVQRRGIAR
jgi:energy-coupling factor transport system permease protein